MRRILAALALMVAATTAVIAHTPQSYEGAPGDPKITPAYAVLVLRKAMAEAELADLSTKFTGRHPDVLSKNFELSVIKLEMEKMQMAEKSRLPKLSGAYGDLILRKVALEVRLNELLRSFKPPHPEVLRTRVEWAAIERELEDILR